ncbi:MAG: hypothetical protein HY331_06500 [Chloroflexi bacterium]|nr:hypothetical protein [Chloroflexota bacterium]
MTARSGRFSASLTPFGGGMLDLDAAYAIGNLTPTPDAPHPAAPPPVSHPHEIPVVGQTPIPPSAVTAPAALPAWHPAPSSAHLADRPSASSPYMETSWERLHRTGIGATSGS